MLEAAYLGKQQYDWVDRLIGKDFGCDTDGDVFKGQRHIIGCIMTSSIGYIIDCIIGFPMAADLGKQLDDLTSTMTSDRTALP